MDGRYLLDTNIVIALLNGDSGIDQQLRLVADVSLPSIALGELYFGAAHSGRPEANAARIDDFAETCTVHRVDAQTARQYGHIKAELQRRGRPIPENDIWIAACALQPGMILITRDKHFALVYDLEIEAW